MSRQWTTGDVEGALRALTQSIDTGTPPDYAAGVAVQLAERSAASSPADVGRTVRRRTMLLAAVILLALGLVTVPAARHAIASWFSFGGVDIRYAPPTSPLPTPTEPVSINAGAAATERTARDATDGRLVVPSALPTPTDIYLYEDGSAAVVTLAYRSVSGLRPTSDTGYALILTEIFDAGQPYLEKILHTGATADAVSVAGHQGVYIAGPQEILMENEGAITSPILPRSSANTLIWSDGSVTLRLEADVERPAALRLGEQITPR